MSSSINPTGSCRVSCHPCLPSTLATLPRPPFAPPPLNRWRTGWGRTAQQGRLRPPHFSLRWPCVLPLLLESFRPPLHGRQPPPIPSICHQHKWSRHILFPPSRLFYGLSCCTWTAPRKLFGEFYLFVTYFKVLCNAEFTPPAYSIIRMPSSLSVILDNKPEVTFNLQEG